MKHQPLKLFLVLVLLLVPAAMRAAEQSYPPHVNVVNVTQAPYGAKGDGVTDDSAVPFNQSEILHAAMVRAGARSTLLPIVPGNHGLGMNSPGNFLLTLRFFDQVLGRSKAPGLAAPGFTASPTSGVAPLVTLTASATPDGNWFAPAGVFLNAASSFGDAALRQVKFFCDGVPLGLDTVAPFNLGTGVTVPGLHVFTAQALTTNGVTVTTPA